MKPNLAFLKKVRDGKVCATFSYSPRTGGVYGFRGGEATYERHHAAGFVNYAPGASLGRPGYVTLTAKGEEALAAAGS